MIRKITENKKRYLALLLLGDEQENMIERYLKRGEMYAFCVGDEAVAVCVVTDEGDGVAEIKNIATAPEYQRKGYGQQLVEFVVYTYRDTMHTMLVGTGDSPLTRPFYEACGFTESHHVPNFFLDNYEKPIVEAGVQLVDMVYFRRALSTDAVDFIAYSCD